MNFYKQFDDVTLEKLDIYSRYLQEWLPVPLSGRMFIREAVIYDLFCGPGVDGVGEGGSPLRAADVIKSNRDMISRRPDISVRLVFNDYEPQYIQQLRGRLGDRLRAESGECLATIDYHCDEFADIFGKMIDEMRQPRRANLLFVDQFGVNNIDETKFKELHSTKRTDVLFFIASNWFWRFVGRPEAANWDFSREDLSNIHYHHVHRFMTEYFRRLVGGDYYLAPFSLKKGSNIYGLIFASHDPLGLQKFLQVAWRKDPHSGEANFDMFEERVGTNQLVMFEARKIREFRDDLENQLLSKSFHSDCEIYLHMLQNGFLNRHARPVITRLCKEKRIAFVDADGVGIQPRLSNQSVSQPRSIVYLDT